MFQLHKVKFSDDRLYRYRLEAKVSDIEKTCLWILLNPSKADEIRSDPTVTRCKGFLKRWGYGRLIVCNLFALRSTDPSRLYTHPDPVGPDNNFYLLAALREADLVVLAWGNHGAFKSRGLDVLGLIEATNSYAKTSYLKLNASGHPAHTRGLRNDTELIFDAKFLNNLLR